MTTTRPEIVHDLFAGDEIDMTRWSHVELPSPDGTTWVCAEPHATTIANDRTLKVEIPRFERSNIIQMYDNPKYMLISHDSFDVPKSGQLTVSAKVGAENLNTTGRDYRDGFVALNVLEMSTGKVFDLAATSNQVFAIHEQLPGYGAVVPFSRIVEDPITIPAHPGKGYLFSVTLDAEEQTVTWRVDGTVLLELSMRSGIPTSIQIGLGLLTLHPVGPEGSRSIKGQGLTGWFRDLRVATVTR